MNATAIPLEPRADTGTKSWRVSRAGGTSVESDVPRSTARDSSSMRNFFRATEALSDGPSVPSAAEVSYRQPQSLAQTVAHMVGVERQRSVRVDVQDVNADVVECLILGFGGQDVTVMLPTTLFPEDMPPRLGRSYDLQIEDRNGIRRAVLSSRPAAKAAHRKQKDELWSLVQAFGE